ncbi:hypothetical protein JCM10450v2_001800 [Rhodotorula kratochvilovae]
MSATSSPSPSSPLESQFPGRLATYLNRMDEKLKALQEKVRSPPLHVRLAAPADPVDDVSQAPSLRFDTPEAKELATTALTHSSLSLTRNNTELARLGEAVSKAAATKALYLSPGLHIGLQYNTIALSFANKALTPLAREYEIDKLLRLGKGVPYVSDEMASRGLVALLGALELTSGPDALLAALKELGIVKLPEPMKELSDGIQRFKVEDGEVKAEPVG